MKERETHHPAKRQLWAERRRAFGPKAISLSRDGLVKTGALPPGGTLPLVLQPGAEGINLTDWAANNRAFIESKLLVHGGLLFRGFDLETQEDMEWFLDSISLRPMHYMEGATPRTELSAKVYTSTEYPPEQGIALHNELNYVISWPLKIIFFALKPALRGGETPIADVRNVFNRIPAKIRERFIEKGWMLVRNFGDGMSLPWQRSFRVKTREELEDYCRRSRVEFEWKGNDRLRTRQVRPAVRRHPVTGECLWFNHIAFWHVSSLDKEIRELFLPKFKQEDLPYNTYYGDGSPIEDEVVEQLRQAYDQETVAFRWHKGDLLLMDNMLAAHGRNPFEGPRRVLVSMGDPYSDYVPDVGFKLDAANHPGGE